MVENEYEYEYENENENENENETNRHAPQIRPSAVHLFNLPTVATDLFLALTTIRVNFRALSADTSLSYFPTLPSQ